MMTQPLWFLGLPHSHLICLSLEAKHHFFGTSDSRTEKQRDHEYFQAGQDLACHVKWTGRAENAASVVCLTVTTITHMAEKARQINQLLSPATAPVLILPDH